MYLKGMDGNEKHKEKGTLKPAHIVLGTKANEVKPAKRKRKPATQEQLNNPFHGVKLKQILEELVAFYGWEYLGDRVRIRCFINNPSMKSSLGFLRRTTWAREHVEDVYLEMLEDKKLEEEDSH